MHLSENKVNDMPTLETQMQGSQGDFNWKFHAAHSPHAYQN